MSPNHPDYIGELHPWLARYAAMAARHEQRLAPYVDADGEPVDEHYAQYDEKRFDNTIEADGFLDALVARVRELVGPPVPGTAFTLTYSGAERHVGVRGTSFVVNGTDLDDAHRTLLTMRSFKEWLDELKSMGNDPDAELDLLYVAAQSHPGVPEWHAYRDFRREQAEALADAEQPAPAPPSILPG
ncbi:hypothetical protein [Streptomyces microflavus]|uniref:hypothetical protein n=1 Tax=Streptomyces microflavus TaxID=1919 RepID=UPI0033DC2F7C